MSTEPSRYSLIENNIKNAMENAGNSIVLSKSKKLMVEQALSLLKQTIDIALEYPVPVVKIANALGIRVYAVEFNDPNTSGAIALEDGKRVIYVNIKEPLTVQRRIVAHEIGHFLIHIPDRFTIKFDKYNNDNMTLEEVEADYFADILLIGEEDLKTAYKMFSKKKQNKRTKKYFGEEVYIESIILQLAEYFGVCTDSTKRRLQDVGLVL